MHYVLTTRSTANFLLCSYGAHREADFANRLLETGDFSDFSVVCGDRTWKAHKIILCRIEYFEKLITSGFKVCAFCSF